MRGGLEIPEKDLKIEVACVRSMGLSTNLIFFFFFSDSIILAFRTFYKHYHKLDLINILQFLSAMLFTIIRKPEFIFYSSSKTKFITWSSGNTEELISLCLEFNSSLEQKIIFKSKYLKSDFRYRRSETPTIFFLKYEIYQHLLEIKPEITIGYQFFSIVQMLTIYIFFLLNKCLPYLLLEYIPKISNKLCLVVDSLAVASFFFFL